MRAACLSAVAVVMLTLASGTSAATNHRASAPRTLAEEPGTNFLVRPSAMTFAENQNRGGTFDYLIAPGITVGAWRRGAHRDIRWPRYGTTAVARATFLTQQCDSLRGRITGCSQRYLAGQVRLALSLSRHGRYTRFVITLLGHGLSTKLPTYGLRRIRLKERGKPHGQLAYSWCAVGDRTGCSHP